MAKGISISIASDTKAAAAGIKSGVLEPLEDASKALTELGRDGDKAGGELEDSMRDAQKETERLADDHQKLSRTISSASKQAGHDISTDYKKGAHEASEGLDEIKESGKSNAIEVAASFDGSAQSIADGFQGLAAEAFAGFGPAGVVAGVAAAAGIGLVSTALGAAQEDADETAERVNSMFEDMIESGNQYASQEFVNDGIKTIIEDTEKYTQAQKDAAESGAPLSTVLRAQAGDLDAIAQVNALASAAQTELTRKQEEYIATNGDSSAAIDAQGFALDDLKERFGRVAAQTDTAAGRARDYNSAIQGTGPLADASKAKVDDLGRSLLALPQPHKVVFDVDDQKVRDAISRIENSTVRVQADLEFRSGGRVL